MCPFETTRNTTLTTSTQDKVIPCRWHHVSHFLHIPHGSTDHMNTQSTHSQCQHHLHIIQHLSKSTVSSIVFAAFDLGSLSNTLFSVEGTIDLTHLWVLVAFSWAFFSLSAVFSWALFFFSAWFFAFSAAFVLALQLFFAFLFPSLSLPFQLMFLFVFFLFLFLDLLPI